MNDNYVIRDGQLYHHGIKGQKWGIRRFQKPDGSLTPAGRKRYGDGDDSNSWRARHKAKAEERARKREASKAAKAEDKVKNAYRKKTVSEMSDEEIRAAIERARLEDAYTSLRPPEVSKGQQFVNAVKGLTTTIAVDEGKKFIGKLGDRILNKYFPQAKELSIDDQKKLFELNQLKKHANDPDYDAEERKIKMESAKVKLESEKLDLERKRNKPDSGDEDLDTRQKRATLEKTEYEALEKKSAYEAKKSTADQAKSEADKAKSEAAKAAAEEAAARAKATKAAADLVASWNKATQSSVSSPSNVSSGESYVRQLANTPIAGLLPPGPV